MLKTLIRIRSDPIVSPTGVFYKWESHKLYNVHMCNFYINNSDTSRPLVIKGRSHTLLPLFSCSIVYTYIQFCDRVEMTFDIKSPVDSYTWIFHICTKSQWYDDIECCYHIYKLMIYDMITGVSSVERHFKSPVRHNRLRPIASDYCLIKRKFRKVILLKQNVLKLPFA